MVYGPVRSDLIRQEGFPHVYHLAPSNPVWDEKLLFHVRKYESAFKVQLTVLDWDYLLSNHRVGAATFMVSELLVDTSQMDPVTGLYDDDADGKHPMKEFQLPLSTAKETPWEAERNPVIMSFVSWLCS
jgi:phosphatidylserine decarboxylase